MPYPRKNINEGEVVVLDLNPHWWFFSMHILTSLPLFLVTVVLFQLNGELRKWASLAYSLFLVLWVFWLGWMYLQWRFTNFVVTSDRIIWRSGVLAKRGVEIPLERINNINFNQSIFERMIGAGDLEIESAGKDSATHFHNVRHPDGVQQEIYRQMEDNTRRTHAYGAPVIERQPTIPEQIEHIAQLAERGLITQEEFAAKKAELLARM